MSILPSSMKLFEIPVEVPENGSISKVITHACSKEEALIRVIEKGYTPKDDSFEREFLKALEK